MDHETPVAAYKSLLRDCLNRRPSGLRQKLAAALGKHKSFISQITNPTYSVPIPAGDLGIIFEVCHLSPEEQRHFLQLYEAAHPGRSGHSPQALDELREIRIAVPAFHSEAMGRRVETTILETAARIIRLAQDAERLAGDAEPGDGNEKIRQRRG